MAKKAKKTTALAVAKAAVPVTASNQALAMIERFATNPDFDVEKMKALMDMRDREMARVAEQAFNAAMAATQREMRPVARDADNPATRSRYASYTALDAALRPIYSAHDFGLSFNTGEAPQPESVRVLCDVTHAGGFSKSYHIDMPADGKGARGNDVMTKTHATGSAVSYGMRYLLKMIFNVAIGEFDDDGNKAGQRQKPQRREPVRDEPPPIDAESIESVESASSQLKITPAQRKRLVEIARRAGRPDADVALWLKKVYGAASSADVLQQDYAAICRVLEGRGALPMPGDGE